MTPCYLIRGWKFFVLEIDKCNLSTKEVELHVERPQHTAYFNVYFNDFDRLLDTVICQDTANIHMTILSAARHGKVGAKTRVLCDVSKLQGYKQLYIMDGPTLLVVYEQSIQMHNLHCGKCFSSAPVVLEVPSIYSGVYHVQSDVVNGFRVCNVCFVCAETGKFTWWTLDTARIYHEFKSCCRSCTSTEPPLLSSISYISSSYCLWTSIPIGGMEMKCIGEPPFLSVASDIAVGEIVTCGKDERTSNIAAIGGSDICCVQYADESSRQCDVAGIQVIRTTCIMATTSCRVVLTEYVPASSLGWDGRRGQSIHDGVTMSMDRYRCCRRVESDVSLYMAVGRVGSSESAGCPRITDLQRVMCSGGSGVLVVGGVSLAHKDGSAVAACGGCVLVLSVENLSPLRVFSGVGTYKLTTAILPMSYQLLMLPCRLERECPYRLCGGHAYSQSTAIDHVDLAPEQPEEGFDWAVVELSSGACFRTHNGCHMQALTSSYQSWRALESCGSVYKAGNCNLYASLIANTAPSLSGVQGGTDKKLKLNKKKSDKSGSKKKQVEVPTSMYKAPKVERSGDGNGEVIEQHGGTKRSKEGMLAGEVDPSDSMVVVGEGRELANDSAVEKKDSRKKKRKKHHIYGHPTAAMSGIPKSSINDIDRAKQSQVLDALQTKARLSSIRVSTYAQELSVKRRTLFGLRVICAEFINSLTRPTTVSYTLSKRLYRGSKILTTLCDSTTYIPLLQQQQQQQQQQQRGSADSYVRPTALSTQLPTKSSSTGSREKQSGGLRLHLPNRPLSTPAAVGTQRSSHTMESNMIDSGGEERARGESTSKGMMPAAAAENSHPNAGVSILAILGSAGKVLGNMSEESRQVDVVVLVCAKNNTKDRVLHNVHLRAASVAGSQDCIDGTILSSLLDRENDTNCHTPFCTSLPIKGQSASVDYIKPGQIVFLSAIFQITLPTKAVASGSSVGFMNASRAMQIARATMLDSNIPCSLLLSLSEIMSVNAAWYESSVTFSSDNKPSSERESGQRADGSEGFVSSSSSVQQPSDLVNGFWNTDEMVLQLRDRLKWKATHELNAIHASVLSNTSQKQQSSLPLHTSPTIRHRQVHPRDTYCASVSCGVVVIPPWDARSLDIDFLTHFHIHTERVLRPLRVVPTFTTRSHVGRSVAGVDEGDMQGLWQHVRSLVAQTKHMNADTAQEGNIVCYSFLASNDFNLESTAHHLTGANGDVRTTPSVDDGTTEGLLLNAAKDIVQSVNTTQRCPLKVIVKESSSDRTVGQETDGLDAPSNCYDRFSTVYHEEHVLFPELLLETRTQSIVFLKLHTQGEISALDLCTSMDEDPIAADTGGAASGGAVEVNAKGSFSRIVKVRALNVSNTDARQVEEALQFKLHTDFLRHTHAYPHSMAIVSPINSFTLVHQSVPMSTVIGLAHHVALSAQSLLHELMAIAGAWREMKLYEHDEQQRRQRSSLRTLGAWMDKSGRPEPNEANDDAEMGAMGMESVQRCNDSCESEAGRGKGGRRCRRIQVTQRLHVKNVEVMMYIFRRQLIVDRVMASLLHFKNHK